MGVKSPSILTGFDGTANQVDASVKEALVSRQVWEGVEVVIVGQVPGRACRVAGLAFIECLSIFSPRPRFHQQRVPMISGPMSNVPAPTPSNHAHWSSQLLSHLLTSSPAVAGRRIAVFPAQVRRAALIGYRQCHVMILVPPQRSGLRLCVSVCVLHPSWGDWHRFQSSRWGFGQVGMAVVLACAVSRHSLRSPGFRIHAGPEGSVR